MEAWRIYSVGPRDFRFSLAVGNTSFHSWLETQGTFGGGTVSGATVAQDKSRKQYQDKRDVVRWRRVARRPSSGGAIQKKGGTVVAQWRSRWSRKYKARSTHARIKCGW